MTLFDLIEAERRKEEGMARAADARATALALAKQYAVTLAETHGEITSDDVALAMEQDGHRYEDLGNAAGSLFRGRFEWTGRTATSARVSTHGRIIRVWRLKP